MGPKKPQKLNPEQLAWGWAEFSDDNSTTTEHIQTAYRVNSKPCQIHHCRRNCKGNPRCVNALGEGKWYQQIKDSHWYEVEDPEKERREPGFFAGLKNLGATCYVNTFLQVWFHNRDIRYAVFQWQDNEVKEESLLTITRPLQDLVESFLPEELDSLLEPKSVCAHLQAVFAQLCYSKRKYIDPTPFINSLGLDAAQQQDAQEFSKLFMCLIEDTLSHQTNIKDNFIQQQFLGHYQYVTKCSGCEGESRRTSQFYELDLNIKGHKTLHDCIGEFLQEEKLDGDNQYACANCNRKQNATRSIHLQSLPPVINIQLLRFVFDRKTGHKKKLNTFIEFAEHIDMSEYVGKPENSVVYDLSAVLIHRGPSAYSGHYVAHIKDGQSGDWYKFNDEIIERMGGKKLELGNEEEIEGKKTPQKPKTNKGFHASRNAYMLVYKARQSDSPTSAAAKKSAKEQKVKLDDLPVKLQRFLEYDDLKFEQWVEERISMRAKNLQTGCARQIALKEMFEKLPWKDGELFEWVPTQWLTHYITEEQSEKVKAPDNADLMCPHGKMNPDAVPKAKCISKTAADQLYELYKGGPRLDSSALCEECVRLKARIIRMRTRIAEDQKEITAFLRSKEVPADLTNWYWVGKLSFRGWKRYAIEKLEAIEKQSRQASHNVSETSQRGELDTSNSSLPLQKGEENKVCQSLSNTSNNISPEMGNGEKTENVTVEKKNANEITASSSGGLRFNEDVQCMPHDNMVVEESQRRLVPARIWVKLKHYFPDAPEYRGDTAPCMLCMSEFEEEMQVKESSKQQAAEQKALLADLYLDRQRPTWEGPHTQLYVVSARFLDSWRCNLKEPMKNERIKSLDNRSFLCSHAGFPFDSATLFIDSRASNLRFLTPDEWNVLTKYVTVDKEVFVNRVTEDSGHVTFFSCPDFCNECYNSRCKEEASNSGTFRNAVIYIRKVEDTVTYAQPMVTSSSETSQNGEDFEFELMENGKRKLLTPIEEDKSRRLDAGAIRRSSRHRRCPGEKQVTVSSTDTLRGLKLKIMDLFSVAPFDQTLLKNGKELSGTQQTTLADMDVRAGDTLYLKEDEPTEDPTFLDIPSESHAEEGFKGTGLLNR